MLAMPQLPESPARAGARGLVKKIAEDHGYISEDVLNGLPADVRRIVKEAMLKKDKMIGSSVMTYEGRSTLFYISGLTLDGTGWPRIFTIAALDSCSSCCRTLTTTITPRPD